MIKSVYGRREGWQSIEIAGSAHSKSPAPGKVVRHVARNGGGDLSRTPGRRRRLRPGPALTGHAGMTYFGRFVPSAQT